MKRQLFVIVWTTVFLFGSIKSEVESERFQHKNGVLVDTWLDQLWQDQPDNVNLAFETDAVKIKHAKTKFAYKAVTERRYCQKLKLLGKDSWRLPTKDELSHIYKNAQDQFNYMDFGPYWTQDTIIHRGFFSYATVYIVDKYGNVNDSMMGYKKRVRCVNGKILDDDTIARRIQKVKEQKIKEKCETVYQSYKNSQDIRKLEYFLDNYSDITPKYYNDIKNKLHSLYRKLFERIKDEHNIAAYEWFIKNYPHAPYVKQALQNIYQLAFEQAKKLDTVDAYNTFIFTYPLAPQVQEANQRAYDIEKKAYTDLGILSFFNKDGKMEKQARKLLIKAKQIERYPMDNGIEKRKAGYIIVANRMYQLLQDEFDDTDATLRYLESQEFKDFVKTFRETMQDIRYTLKQIQSNTSSSSKYLKELVEISSQGFADAKSDRAMAAFYTKQHREWEKYMHFKDKGYQ